METHLKHLRIKLLTLTTLLLLSLYFGSTQRVANACLECVTLTGGLCVGCDPNVSKGHTFCEPNQQTCRCEVGGTCGSMD
jgi:hypothetical protein